MEWPDAVGLLKHWNKAPPVNELLADFLGIKSTSTVEEDPEAEALVNRLSAPEFNALLAQHGLPTGA